MIQFFLVGCGSGLSGETLSENEHHWIGLDISKSMLGLWTVGFEVTWIVCVGLPVICLCFNGYFSTDVALEREVDGDLLLADMGQVWGLSIHVEMYDWFCLCFSFPFGSSVVYFRLDHQIRKKKIKCWEGSIDKRSIFVLVIIVLKIPEPAYLVAM